MNKLRGPNVEVDRLVVEVPLVAGLLGLLGMLDQVNHSESPLILILKMITFLGYCAGAHQSF